MKKLLVLTITLSYLTAQLAQAADNKNDDKVSAGVGISAGYTEQMVGERKESTSYEILPLPIIDAEANYNFNQYVGFQMRASGGISLVNQKNEVFIEATPMLVGRPSKETSIAVGVKLKHADGRYQIGNYSYNNAAIYGEIRTQMSERFKVDGYVGVSKNIDQDGFGVRIGIIKNLVKNQ